MRKKLRKSLCRDVKAFHIYPKALKTPITAFFCTSDKEFSLLLKRLSTGSEDPLPSKPPK
jgi:hypothetical protein